MTITLDEETLETLKAYRGSHGYMILMAFSWIVALRRRGHDHRLQRTAARVAGRAGQEPMSPKPPTGHFGHERHGVESSRLRNVWIFSVAQRRSDWIGADARHIQQPLARKLKHLVSQTEETECTRVRRSTKGAGSKRMKLVEANWTCTRYVQLAVRACLLGHVVCRSCQGCLFGILSAPNCPAGNWHLCEP